MGWVSPTSHDDVDNHWDDETNVYDGNTATYGEPDLTGAGHFLELIPDAPISCDKIRFWASITAKNLDVDVYYDGGWNHVYAGGVVGEQWEEKAIPAGTKTVEKARVAWDFRQQNLYEFEFNEAGVTHALAGVIAGVAGVSGTVVMTLLVKGASAGVAGVSGAIARTLVVKGVSAGVCSASAALINQKWLAGVIAGVASATGSLTNQKWLAGVVAGKAVVSATLINIKWLAGVIAGVATVSANLFHVRVAVRVLSAVRNLLALRNIPPVR